MRSQIVTNNSVTFVNSKSPLALTQKQLDLDTCYNASEIVVKVHACALNPVDTLLHHLCPPYLFGNTPKTMSRDYSGEVIRCGEDVTGFKIGDEVCGVFDHIYGDRGALSEYLILNPLKNKAIYALPQKSYDAYDKFEVGCAWPLVFGTAFGTLYRYNKHLNKDSSILVLGASTQVGNALVQIAKNHLNVKTCIGVCSKASIPFNKSVGYDECVPYDDGDPVTNLRHLIRDKYNSSLMFDLIVDCVGNEEFLFVVLDFLKPKYTQSYYVTIAGNNKLDYKHPDYGHLLSLKGMYRTYNPFRKFNYTFSLLEANDDYMKLGHEMIESGKYKPRIEKVYSLTDYQKAVDALETHDAKGKIVIKMP